MVQLCRTSLLVWLSAHCFVTSSNAANTQDGERRTQLGNSSSFNHLSHASPNIVMQTRQESDTAVEINLINPLSWQLSSSSIPSLDDQTIPDISNQPKGVIASAFPFTSGSNYSPGIRVPAGWSFSIGFNAVFSTTAPTTSLTYTLRLQDSSELPVWMVYDAEYMTLSGLTPWSDPSSQIVYRLRMIGAFTSSLSVSGSGAATPAAVAQSFTLLVAQHTFEYLPSSTAQAGPTVLNFTTGGEHIEQPLSFGVDAGSISGILLDGTPITESEIKDVTIDPFATEWATLKPAPINSPRLLVLTFASGSSVKDLDKTELPIRVTNIYGELLQVVLKLNYQGSVFRYAAGMPGWWDSVNLTIGQDYNISLYQNLTRTIPQQQQNGLEVKPLPAWIKLQFDPQLAISGSVPANIRNQTTVTLTFRYIDPETFAVSIVQWNISLFSSPSPNTVPGTGDTSGNVNSSSSQKGLSRPKIIAIAVLSSLLGLALLLAIAWFVRKLFLARMLEKSKWASVLRPLHNGLGGHWNGHTAAEQVTWDSPPSFTSNLKGHKSFPAHHMEESLSHLPALPQPAYHRTSTYHKRPSSPSMLKSFIETAMLTPTKKARKMVAEMKDRSLKRYTRSFMSYPIDYPLTNRNGNTPDVDADRSGGEQDKSAIELVSIGHRAASGPAQVPPPSPSPQRPTSVIPSLAPFPFIDPPLSGLPSTAFTSDSFLHGHDHQTASPASWEQPGNAFQVSHMRYHTSNVQYYAGSTDSLHGQLMIANPEVTTLSDIEGKDGDRWGLQQQRPPNQFFLAELCHQQSTIIRSRDPETGFPYSITSAGNSFVNVEERHV